VERVFSRRCGPFALALLLSCGAPAPHAAAPGPAVPRLKAPKPIDPSARGAAYLTAVALQLQPGWGQFLDDCRLRLPASHPLNNMELAATAELAIDASGYVTIIRLERSGNADFDRALTDVVIDAQRLPPPPPELFSDDDRVYVTWMFARDSRQAGPATARIMDIALPLDQIVETWLDRGDLGRAAKRLSTAPAGHREVLFEELAYTVLSEALASKDRDPVMAALAAVPRVATGTASKRWKPYQRLLAEIAKVPLASHDNEQRLAVIAAVTAAADMKRGVGFLRQLPDELRKGDPAVAAALAHSAFWLLHDDAVARLLRPMATEPHEPDEVRALALRLSTADPALATELVKRLEGGDAAHRAAWCAALAGADIDVAAPLIGRGLRDGDAAVRRECLDAVMLHERSQPTHKQIAALEPRIRDLARDRDNSVRARAVAALLVLDTPHYVRAARDPSGEVRAAYAKALEWHMKVDELRADAVALASDSDPAVRAAAWHALAVAPLATVDPAAIARAVVDPSADVRKAAIALATEPQLDKLVASDESPDVRTEALIQLVHVRGRVAMEKDLLERIAAAPPASVERVRAALAWLLAN